MENVAVELLTCPDDKKVVQMDKKVAHMPALHHIALACKDLEKTHEFYHDVLGLPLVHTEMDAGPHGGYVKHVFYDLGDGSCIAFFDLHGVGEPPDFSAAISTGLGLPSWVNHLALRADAARAAEAKERATAGGVEVTMELDHGWCKSVYFTDPNGILVEFCVDSPGFVPNEDEALRLLHSTPGGVGGAG